VKYYNDEKIKADVNHRIQVGWLKWRRVSSVLCGTKVPFKLKEKNMMQLSYQQCIMEQSVGRLRTITRVK